MMPVPGNVKEKAARILLAVFDVDGVMTDGSITYGENDGEYKTFHAHDGMGLQMIRDAGIKVAVISSRQSSIVSRRMSELGIEHVLQGVPDKQQALKGLADHLDINAESIAFVGDDLADLPAMSFAGLAIAVAGANRHVVNIADWTTAATGGKGGVREVCEMLLEAQNRLDDCLKNYIS